MLGTDSTQSETIKSLELSYQTRGTQKVLNISPDSITVSLNGKAQSYKTTEKQWKSILKSLEKVKLSGIDKLKRPSTKAFSDGAFAAQLTVITYVKTYQSSGFDHNKPPTALVKVIEAMKEGLRINKSEVEF
jgi:alkaline phosphatase